MLKDNEVINNLFGYDGLKVIQRTDMFHFSLDSTLISNFVSINQKVKKIVDLGAGNAPIPLMLSLRTKAAITGVEIQEESVSLARRNIELNDLHKQITIVQGDLKGINKRIGHHQFDLVTCNPPFFKVKEDSNINKNDYLTIARHEVKATLDDVIKETMLLLKNSGTFAMVHRPDRLVEILEIMTKYQIHPKRLRFVYPRPGKDANTILIEGKKSNPGGLKILPPLYIYKYDKGTEYTDEVSDMFMRRANSES
ncbi:tRNA1(Val) (adenine(37)-N6)-methyltransferase [Haloplasma contractile]|uniref:Trans-aconitate 2-methyltransferase protein n=1 Tax=Haloplasma contractile SSD-17B TaxID=1033810 RepID=U2EB69_9MOLU|nr:tRNA1(Val) (adenine(37)-N6)-methyltransferase [Haloplasma contractile]ERJ12348.1 trans-aconitate 2-methyltransferase protein [Haloplasma contractile SSD-17B]